MNRHSPPLSSASYLIISESARCSDGALVLCVRVSTFAPSSAASKLNGEAGWNWRSPYGFLPIFSCVPSPVFSSSVLSFQIGTGGCGMDKDGQCCACVLCECQCDLLFPFMLLGSCVSCVVCCAGKSLVKFGASTRRHCEQRPGNRNLDRRLRLTSRAFLKKNLSVPPQASPQPRRGWS